MWIYWPYTSNNEYQRYNAEDTQNESIKTEITNINITNSFDLCNICCDNLSMKY